MRRGLGVFGRTTFRSSGEVEELEEIRKTLLNEVNALKRERYELQREIKALRSEKERLNDEVRKVLDEGERSLRKGILGIPNRLVEVKDVIGQCLKMFEDITKAGRLIRETHAIPESGQGQR